MDWLRIGAFALLILYHVAMVFAPWGWVIKAARTHEGLIVPMALVTPWRLALLFAVSGYASRKLLARSTSVGGFVRGRNARLLVPLAFGMAVLVPIEMWVRVRSGGYPFGYLHFWLADYWRTGTFAGVAFPSWEHLWFVAYLWLYTMLLGVALAIAGARTDRWTARAAEWLAEGHRLFAAPLLVLATLKLALLFVVPERQGVFSDWAGHAEYLPIFLLGFLIGGTEALWTAIARGARPAFALAVVAGAVVAAVEVAYPGTAIPPHATMALDRAARVAMAWSMIVLLFHVAQTLLDRDHRWRGSLVQAVFPAYLIHHPAIVLAALWVLPLDLSAPAAFAGILGVTVFACWAAVALGRRIGWLGTLIGLARPLAAGSAGAHGRKGLFPAE